MLRFRLLRQGCGHVRCCARQVLWSRRAEAVHGQGCGHARRGATAGTGLDVQQIVDAAVAVHRPVHGDDRGDSTGAVLGGA